MSITAVITNNSIMITTKTTQYSGESSFIGYLMPYDSARMYPLTSNEDQNFQLHSI